MIGAAYLCYSVHLLLSPHYTERTKAFCRGSWTSFTLWIETEIPIPTWKFLPARVIVHWENTPPNAIADTTANYDDGNAAKLLKFMSHAIKMDLVTALMNFWHVLLSCSIHFLVCFLQPWFLCWSAGIKKRIQGLRPVNRTPMLIH